LKTILRISAGLSAVAIVWLAAYWYFSLSYMDEVKTRSRVGELVSAAQAEIEPARAAPRCPLRTPCPESPLKRYEISGGNAVTLFLKGGELDNRKVVLRAKKQGDGTTQWTCESDAPSNLVPPLCRNPAASKS
jgi:hypothetical protein